MVLAMTTFQYLLLGIPCTISMGMILYGFLDHLRVIGGPWNPTRRLIYLLGVFGIFASIAAQMYSLEKHPELLPSSSLRHSGR